MEFKIENDELVIIAGVIIVTHIIGGIVLYNLPINTFVESFVGGAKDVVEGFKNSGGSAVTADGNEAYEGFE